MNYPAPTLSGAQNHNGNAKGADLAAPGLQAPATDGGTVEQSAAQQSPTGGLLFRGRSVDELIPKIQQSLGEDAIVVGRRSGLEGGLGGFFQHPYVEIEAVAGAPGIDVRDDEPALPESLADSAMPLSEVRAEAATAPERAGFAAELQRADCTLAPAHELESPAQAQSVQPQPEHAAMPQGKSQQALIGELRDQGFSDELCGQLLGGALHGVLPLAPRIGVRRALRSSLQARIPALPVINGPASIVVVGPGGAGKTSCVQALSDRFCRSGALRVSEAQILPGELEGELSLRMAPEITNAVQATSKQALGALAAARAEGLCLIDTPAVSAANRPQIKVLARLLSEIAPERTIVALPATLGGKAAAQLLQALAPLRANAIVITHADETDQLGMAIEAACGFELAPELLLGSGRHAARLTRLDPFELAERMLP